MSNEELYNLNISKSNPLGLELGDRVRFSNQVTFNYDLNGIKKGHVTWGPPQTGVVIGVTRKAEGKYVVPDGWKSIQGGLKVSKYVIVYEVKISLKRSVVSVLPEDIKVV